MVPWVSWASVGSTSRETNPSLPPVSSKTGRNTSQAAATSSVTIVQPMSSVEVP
jgi:hypothetical protein